MQQEDTVHRMCAGMMPKHAHSPAYVEESDHVEVQLAASKIKALLRVGQWVAFKHRHRRGHLVSNVMCSNQRAAMRQQ